MERVEELYSNDEIELTELIQEWIDENNYFLCCKINENGVKCKCR